MAELLATQAERTGLRVFLPLTQAYTQSTRHYVD